MPLERSRVRVPPGPLQERRGIGNRAVEWECPVAQNGRAPCLPRRNTHARPARADRQGLSDAGAAGSNPAGAPGNESRNRVRRPRRVEGYRLPPILNRPGPKPARPRSKSAACGAREHIAGARVGRTASVIAPNPGKHATPGAELIPHPPGPATSAEPRSGRGHPPHARPLRRAEGGGLSGVSPRGSNPHRPRAPQLAPRAEFARLSSW